MRMVRSRIVTAVVAVAGPDRAVCAPVQSLASTCSAFVSVCVYNTVVTSSSAWAVAPCASRVTIAGVIHIEITIPVDIANTHACVSLSIITARAVADAVKTVSDFWSDTSEQPRVALSAPLLAALAIPLLVTDTGSGVVVVRVVDASGTVEVGISGTAVTSVVT
jgi:hypothetical protein